MIKNLYSSTTSKNYKEKAQPVKEKKTRIAARAPILLEEDPFAPRGLIVTGVLNQTGGITANWESGIKSGIKSGISGQGMGYLVAFSEVQPDGTKVLRQRLETVANTAAFTGRIETKYEIGVQTIITPGVFSKQVTRDIRLKPPSASPSITNIKPRVVDNQITALISFKPPRFISGNPSYIQSHTVQAELGQKFNTDLFNSSNNDIIPSLQLEPPAQKISTQTQNSNTVLVNGLTEGQNYTFSITANTASGKSPQSARLIFDNRSLPVVPTNLSIEPTTNFGEVTFSWKNNSKIVGTKTGNLIQVFNDINMIYSVTVTRTENCIINNLNIGIPYKFTVFQYASVNNSLLYSPPASSNPFTLTIPSSNPSFVAIANDTSSVNLRWLKPVSLGNPSTFRSYNISTYQSQNTDKSLQDLSIKNENTTKTTITNLKPGNDYTFSIRTENTSGNSQTITSNSVRTYKVPDPVITAFVDPSFDQTGALQLNWLPPSFPGYPSFTGFNVYYDTIPINKDTSPHIFTDSQHYITENNIQYDTYYCDISNLKIDTSYNYLIDTSNNYGVSVDFSSSFQLSKPGRPAYDLKQLLGIDSTSVTAAYFPQVTSNDKLDRVKYRARLMSGDMQVASRDIQEPINEYTPKKFTIGGLSLNPDQDYTLTIEAINISGSSLALESPLLRYMSQQE